MHFFNVILNEMQKYRIVNILGANTCYQPCSILLFASFFRTGRHFFSRCVCVCVYVCRQTIGVMQSDADLGITIFCLISLYIKS